MYGNTHLLSEPCSKDITEVACRNYDIEGFCKIHLSFSDEFDIRINIVSDLRSKSSPVDGVRRREHNIMLIERNGKFHVAEDLLNTCLCIIKAAVNCDYMRIGSARSCHLKLLCFGNAACRIEYDDLCSGKILEALKCSLTRVTRSSRKDADLLMCACLLCRSSHEMRQELECNILECARRSVPEL